MISLDHVEQFKLDLVQSYRMLAATLTGRYLAIQTAAGTPAGMAFVGQFTADARAHIARFVASANEQIDAWASALGNGVSIDERAHAFKGAVSALASGNATDLAHRLAHGGLNLKSLFNRQVEGAVGMLLQRQLTQPALKSLDSAGRIWDSEKLLTTLARDFAYQCLVDAQAYYLSLNADTAKVTYADPEHPYYGAEVSLSGENAHLPSLASVRKVIFHPNASAELTHV